MAAVEWHSDCAGWRATAGRLHGRAGIRLGDKVLAKTRNTSLVTVYCTSTRHVPVGYEPCGLTARAMTPCVCEPAPCAARTANPTPSWHPPAAVGRRHAESETRASPAMHRIASCRRIECPSGNPSGSPTAVATGCRRTRGRRSRAGRCAFPRGCCGSDSESECDFVGRKVAR